MAHYEYFGLRSCDLPEHIARYFPQLDAIPYYGECFEVHFQGTIKDIVRQRKEFMRRILQRRMAPRVKISHSIGSPVPDKELEIFVSGKERPKQKNVVMSKIDKFLKDRKVSK
jgi:hypothetical protein